MSEETDELYRCGLAYEDMEETSKIAYKIKFFAEDSFKIQYEKNKKWHEIPVQKNTSHEINIIFTPDEFYHLSGLHKFLDMKMKPETAYKRVLRKPKVGKPLTFEVVSQSQYFFDDIDESNNEEKEIREPSFAKSDFLGRLSSLENLYSTIAQSRLDENSNDAKLFELKIYAWDRTASNSERPHNSTIQANFLIEIYDKNNSQKPYTDFFIVKGEDGTYRGMSVFPSEVSYSCDDIGRKVPEVTVLSFETLKKGKGISIISEDDRIITDCIQREADHNERVAKEMLQDPNKEERKKFFSKLGNQRSRLIKKENRLNKENYYKMIETDLLCSEFSEFDLKSLKSGMEQSLDTPNTSEKKKACLEYEISAVETIIELKKMLNELEQLLNLEDFSVDDYWQKLSAISEYLKNQNVGRDLILKVASIIERQKENCDEFTAELIDDEVKEMKQTAEQKPKDRIDFMKSGSIMAVQFQNNHINQFSMKNDAMVSGLPFGAVLYHLADSFSQLQESVIEKIHDFVNRARQTTDSIINTVSATFHKKQEQDIKEQSQSAPETEIKDTEKSPDDTYFIIMDNTGVQGYKDYFTIVSVSELDFQVQLTYEAELQSKKQEMEQSISEEKTPAPEHRKKQAEYDDF